MLINRSDNIFYYPFEGNVSDFSSSGNNGTVNGTSTYNNSISGRAFDFNGSTNVGTGLTGMGTGSFTVFARCNFDTLAGGNKRIISKQEVGVNSGWVLFYSPSFSKLRFLTRNQANTANIVAEINISASTIYSIRAWFDSGNEVGLEVYETDGTITTDTVSVADTAYTGNALPIMVGSDSDVGAYDQYIDGKIDDILVVDGAVLTDEDFYRYSIGLGITDK